MQWQSMQVSELILNCSENIVFIARTMGSLTMRLVRFACLEVCLLSLVPSHFPLQWIAQQHVTDPVCVSVARTSACAIGFSLQASPWFAVSTLWQLTSCRLLIYSGFASASSVLNVVSSETVGIRIDEERLYRALSFGITSSLLDALLGRFGTSVTDLTVPVLIVSLMAVLVRLDSLPHARVKISHLRSSLCTTLRHYGSTFQTIAFFVAVGAILGSLQLCGNIVFLYLHQLLMSYTLLGVAVIMQLILEIPLLHNSKSLLSRFSARKMLAIAGAAAIHTVVPKGLGMLLVGPLHGITFAMYMPAPIELMKETTRICKQQDWCSLRLSHLYVVFL